MRTLITFVGFCSLLLVFVQIKNRQSGTTLPVVETIAKPFIENESVKLVANFDSVETSEKSAQVNDRKNSLSFKSVKAEQPTVASNLNSDDQNLEDEALLNLKENEPEKAESTLRSILDKSPANKVALGELLFLLENSKRIDEAKDLLETIVNKCTSCSDARLALGEVYLNEKSFEQALSSFKEATNFPDVKDAAFRKLYTAYGQSGKKNEAISTLKKMIASSNNEIHRLKRLGVETNILEQVVNSDRKELAKLEQNLKRRVDG